MALTLAALTFLALCGFCLGFASLGDLILLKLKFQMRSDGEHLLLAVAIGLLITEVLLFLIQTTNHIRAGCLGLAGLLLAFVLQEWRSIQGRLRNVFAQASQSSRVGKSLSAGIALVAVVEFLVSQAPLTGSDALHYHFTFQKQILEDGFHPVFSNSHSFLCGQHHLLILFGLALQGQHLALGFIFLGGVLTTLCLTQLISRWVSGPTAALFGLLFLLTPLVFWQISASGAPDIYIAFLACLVVMILCQDSQGPTWRRAVITGFLVGGIAGAKYTGLVIASAFLLAAALEFKSVVQLFLFASASLLSGIWPYLRNFLWTGDPVFPLLGAKLSPHLVTSVGLDELAIDTGASSTHHLSRLIPSVFFAGTRPIAAPGLWEFFGPLVLALAPLLLLTFRNKRLWRVPLLVWVLSSIVIFYSSGLPRFVFPLFPIALSCVAAGWEASRRRNWRIADPFILGLAILLAASGSVGLAEYAARPILAAIGVLSKTQYLEQFSPDYQVVESINESLAGQDPQLRTLVFVRHLYYLQIPYVNGDPESSFEVDPDRLQTPAAWRHFFDEKSIGFVVRSPDYPEPIEQALLQLERDGYLFPFHQAEVQNFEGKRINGVRTTIPVVVLKVKR